MVGTNQRKSAQPPQTSEARHLSPSDAEVIGRAISKAIQKQRHSSLLDLLILAGLGWGILTISQSPQPTEQTAQSSVDALLETIAYGEGTPGKDGYFTQFTGRKFTDTAQHPQQVICDGSLCSDASGKWQFLSTTWQPLQQKLNLPDFSPKSQRLAAIELLKQRGSYQAIQSGDFDQAVFNACEEWASLPCFEGDTRGAHDQPVKTMEDLRAFYQKQLSPGEIKPEQKSGIKFSNPHPGARITSRYAPCRNPDKSDCRIHPVTEEEKEHTGLDLSIAIGAPILAAADGEVVFTVADCVQGTSAEIRSCGGGYGNFVEIKHDNGYSTLYAHLHTVNVQKGMRVVAEQVIGTEGSTGQSSGGHLHFEIRKGVEHFDPLKYFPENTWKNWK